MTTLLSASGAACCGDAGAAAGGAEDGAAGYDAAGCGAGALSFCARDTCGSATSEAASKKLHRSFCVLKIFFVAMASLPLLLTSFEFC